MRYSTTQLASLCSAAATALPSKLLTVFTAILLATVSTARSAEETDETGVVYFENHIRPILALRCYECHSAGSGAAEGGLLLDDRAGWIGGGDRGPAVVPGDVDESLLIRAVRYDDPDVQMPPSQSLPAEEIAKLEHWVRIGAPTPQEDMAIAMDDPSDPVAGKAHWAYQPLDRRPPPVVHHVRWPRSPIDRFVLERLEQEGLSPAPDAQPRDLVRRVYIQLTGLPPTPQQVTGFLGDTSPDSLEGLVDRLLSSPQFGQRWGRHWLDLARYADSNGLDENFLFREAWRYRNWVIDASNADMPFDRFVLEQLAGDSLPFDSIEQRDRQRIAAGFLVVGPKVLLGDGTPKQRMEIADEQIDTIGRALLGQTLGCARCHDHKFDPIPTADYYSMAGILTSTDVMERRWMLGTQRVMERLVGLGPSGDQFDAAYEQYWRQLPKRKETIETAKSVLDLLKKEDQEALGALLEKSAEAIAEEAQDASLPISQRLAAQEKWITELEADVADAPPIPPRAMIPADADEPADEHIRLAGQFDRLGKKVPRGFLQVLCDQSPAEIPAQQSGRIELSRWLTRPDGRAGQLAARVQVNRIWHHLIGRGIVRTVDNFGRTGEAPTHPELLDYLAVQLIDSGWSRKAVIREIVLSRTFALSSQHDAVNHASDPDNRYLWRANRRRLAPEAMRDAMLAAAGQLDSSPMDSTVWYLGDQATAVGDNEVRRRTDFPCRSVYLPVIRNDLPELFDVFDFADPHTTTGARSETTVPTQGLFILNDEMVMDAAEATARRILADASRGEFHARIERMFELLFHAAPTDDERHAIEGFLQQTTQRFQSDGKEDPELHAWAILCHALFASSRFQYLE